MMRRPNRRSQQNTAALLAVLLMWGFRMWGKFQLPFWEGLAYVRSAVYILAFLAWGGSLYVRVLHSQIRHHLLMSAALMVFWIAVRTVKYLMTRDPWLIHWLWYLYYLPMLFLPLCSLFIARSVGRTENYRLPSRFRLLYIPAGILLLSVLTNDLHHLVFTFPPDGPRYPESGYGYGPAYYLIYAWMLLIPIGSLVILLTKNRRGGRLGRIRIPAGMLSALVCYSVLVVLSPQWLHFLLGDMPIVNCLLIASCYESLLQLGFIPNNSRHEELFARSSVAAAIFDDDLKPMAASDNYEALSPELLRSAVTGSVVTEDAIRLSSAPIAGGRVFWREDLSELTATMDRLAKITEELSARRRTAEQELAVNRRRQQVIQKKSLYDRVMRETEAEIRRYMEQLDSLELSNEAALDRRTVLRITVICAFIKRKISLIFLAGEDEVISADQFDTCIGKDSLPCIGQTGAKLSYRSELKGTMPVRTAIHLYQAFHQEVMGALDTLRSLDILLTEEKGVPCLVMTIGCRKALGSEASMESEPGRSGTEEPIMTRRVTLRAVPLSPQPEAGRSGVRSGEGRCL